MVVLVVLNIILIVLLIFLTIYILNNKGFVKNDDEYYNDDDDDKDDSKIERGKHKQNKKEKIERVFVGRFISDEEYQQMVKNRKSDISILLEDIDSEYEYLKELRNNGWSERNNTR